MKKIYSYTILILFGIYIIFITTEPSRIFTYTTENFYYPILAAGLVSLSIGIIGLVIKIKNYKFQVKNSKEIISREKGFFLFSAFVILGILINPLFFLFAIFALFIDRKSYFSKFLNGSIFKGALLSAILVSAILFPSKQISSATADQRIGNLNNVNLTDVKAIESGFSTSTKNYSIADWISSLSFNPDLSFYKGKEVEAVGFIFAPSTYPEDVFLVGRFVIRCCAADATPIGLKVKYDWKNEFKQDEWVKVTGTFDIQEVDGNEELIIVPTLVERTDVPERPYIS